MAERNVLLKNVKHPFLVGLHYSFQTKDKLYFVLDFVNGGEVSICGWEAQGWHLPYHISKATIWQIKPICYKYSYCWGWQWHLSLYDLKKPCTQKWNHLLILISFQTGMTTLFCGTEKKDILKNVFICTVKISGDLIDLHVFYHPKHKVIEFNRHKNE